MIEQRRARTADPATARWLLALWLCLAALAAAAADGPEGWHPSRQGHALVFVPPGESAEAAALLRLEDQPAQGDVASQLQRWLDALAAAAGGRPASSEPVRQGSAARGAWASWVGHVDGPTGSRWWLLMVRHEGRQAVGVLLNAADAAGLGRHARAAALYFDAATARADAGPPVALPAQPSREWLVGVWTNLPPPADTPELRRERLLASGASGLWLDLRADGTLRYASKAPRVATAGGLTTGAGQAPLVNAADRLDGRYQEGTWRLEGEELVLSFERGRHLDAVDRPDANQPWYRGGGRRYPLQITPEGGLRLAVSPGQWFDPLRRVSSP